jgi:hypothetical protein
LRCAEIELVKVTFVGWVVGQEMGRERGWVVVKAEEETVGASASPPRCLLPLLSLFLSSLLVWRGERERERERIDR